MIEWRCGEEFIFTVFFREDVSCGFIVVVNYIIIFFVYKEFLEINKIRLIINFKKVKEYG